MNQEIYQILAQGGGLAAIIFALALLIKEIKGLIKNNSTTNIDVLLDKMEKIEKNDLHDLADLRARLYQAEQNISEIRADIKVIKKVLNI